jgi:hypothetical protein
MESGEHIQELYTVYLTRFQIYKTPNKNLGGEGASDRKTTSTFTGQFLRKDDI